MKFDAGTPEAWGMAEGIVLGGGLVLVLLFVLLGLGWLASREEL